MSEERERYIVGGRAGNREVLLAAERLKQFCKQFERFDEKEKEVCIERVDTYSHGLLAGLYDAINEYME